MSRGDDQQEKTVEAAASRAVPRKKILLAAIPLGSGNGAVWGSGIGGDVLGYAMTEEGVVIAQHLSSSEGFAKHDMGLTSKWQHERYEKYAPQGFDLEWVDDVATHPGWQAALALNRVRRAEAEEDATEQSGSDRRER